jgi:hypothetical protein
METGLGTDSYIEDTEKGGPAFWEPVDPAGLNGRRAAAGGGPEVAE